MKPEAESAGRLAVRHVAVLSVNYHPEPTGIGPYVTELAEEFARRGATVSVTTAHPHYPDWEVDEDFRSRTALREERGVSVRRVPVLMPSGLGIKERAKFELSYVCRAVRHVLRTDADIVIGYTPGLMSGVLSRIAARRAGARHVLVVQDLAGRGIGQSGLTTLQRLSKVVQGLERFAARKADLVIAISPAFTPVLEEIGVPPERIAVLGNWLRHSPPPADPAIVERFRRELAPDGQQLILHAGSMGSKQGLGQLVDAAARLDPAKHRVVLVGMGLQRPTLEAAAEGVDACEILDPVPEADLRSLLAAADTLALCQAPSNLDMSFPSKLGEYLRAERQILAITPPGGALDDYLRATQAARVVASGDIDGIATSIKAMAGSESEAERLRLAAVAAQRDWDRSILIERWIAAILGRPDPTGSVDLDGTSTIDLDAETAALNQRP